MTKATQNDKHFNKLKNDIQNKWKWQKQKQIKIKCKHKKNYT